MNDNGRDPDFLLCPRLRGYCTISTAYQSRSRPRRRRRKLQSMQGSLVSITTPTDRISCLHPTRPRPNVEQLQRLTTPSGMPLVLRPYMAPFYSFKIRICDGTNHLPANRPTSLFTLFVPFRPLRRNRASSWAEPSRRHTPGRQFYSLEDFYALGQRGGHDEPEGGSLVGNRVPLSMGSLHLGAGS